MTHHLKWNLMILINYNYLFRKNFLYIQGSAQQLTLNKISYMVNLQNAQYLQEKHKVDKLGKENKVQDSNGHQNRLTSKSYHFRKVKLKGLEGDHLWTLNM